MITTPEQERLLVRGRTLAHVAWQASGYRLARVPKPCIPPRSEFRGLEAELGRPLTAAEETTLIYAYRTQLHLLNAQHELARASRVQRRGDA